jgi:uncharacterized protein involved in exopolysaccharide biosynthesis
MISKAAPKPPSAILEDDSVFDRGIAFLFRHKGTLLLAAVLGGAAGFAISFCFTPLYNADAVLIPSDEMLGLTQGGALGGLGGLGGLASLVGVNTPGGSKQNEAVETLRSRGLTRSYIESNGLLPIIFKDKWDSTANKWKTSGHIPTLEDGYREFDKNIRSVVENRKSGLVNISVTWDDPRLAKQWVDGLVEGANDLLRKQAIERSTRNLEYLQKASDATSIMEVKSTIYKLMESEIKKQMIASGDRNYAFRVVDPAVVPERKVFPARSRFLIFGALVGVLTWSAILMLRNPKATMA